MFRPYLSPLSPGRAQTFTVCRTGQVNVMEKKVHESIEAMDGGSERVR